MTEKLYLNDSYCRSFSATVVSCEAVNGKFGVVLDKTAFFPEGGGQAADRGTINQIQVQDVQLQGDSVIHYLESELTVGETVQCELDWELRFTRMQSHTGEHILSGIVHSLYKYDNIGFHMNDELIVVDFNGSLTADDIKIVEIKSNEAIYKNADVIALYPSKDEVETMEFRSKKEITSDLRIISIGEDIDSCACCAPHVAKTGEVGLIKIIDFSSYKQGTRITMVAGKTALLDYMGINKSIKELMKITSSPRNLVADAVSEKYKQYQDLNYEYQKVANQLALSELKLSEVDDSVYSITENLNFEEMRYCSNSITENGCDVCILISSNEDGYLYVVSSKNIDVRPIVKALNEEFNGKGGGKNDYSQGKISSATKEKIEEFIKKILKK